jgi:hypothetical protein
LETKIMFRDQIQAYLDCFEGLLEVGLTNTDFAECDIRGRPDERNKALYYRILRTEPLSPNRETWRKFVAKLQWYYDEATRECPGVAVERRQLVHERLSTSGVNFLERNGERKRVSLAALRKLYKESRELVFVDLEVKVRADDDSVVLATILTMIDQLPPEALMEMAKELIEQLPLEALKEVTKKLIEHGVYRKFEGSTVVRIEVPGPIAEHLALAFASGEFKDRLPSEIENVRVIKRPGRTIFDPSRPELSLDPSRAEAELQTLWRQVQIRDSVTRPWRRLRWLMSPYVGTSPLSRTIAESAKIAYATRGLLADNGRALKREITMAWLIWPILTATLLLATLWPLSWFIPTIALGTGLASGVLLCIAGGQVCGFVVAPTAAGAGGIFIGWAFGLAQALTINRINVSGGVGTELIMRNFFTAVTGGPVGLSASGWLSQLPIIEIIVMIAATGCSIALSGWFMAQPMNAAVHESSDWPDIVKSVLNSHRLLRRGLSWGTRAVDIVGGLVGSLAGVSIGAIFGFYSLTTHSGLSPVAAFSLAFGAVGGVVFCLTIWLAKKRNLREAAYFGLAHSAVVVPLCLAVAYYHGSFQLILLSVLTALYHATWFTAAFIVGARFSRRAAVIATTLEGAGGFMGFIFYQMLQSY